MWRELEADVKAAGCFGVVALAAAFELASARSAVAADAAFTAASKAPATAPAEPEALTFENRYIVTFRATVFGSTPAVRARAVLARLEALPADIGGDAVAITPLVVSGERGFAVRVGKEFVFGLGEADVDPLANETLDNATSAAAARLAEALTARRDQHSLPLLFRAVGKSLAATVILGGILWILMRVKRRLTAEFSRRAEKRVAGLVSHGIHVESVVLPIVRGLTLAVLWAVALVAIDLWLSFVLGCFPLTRPWASTLTTRLLEILAGIGLALLDYVPRLVTLVVIFFLARLIAAFVKNILDSLEQGRLSLPGFYPETTRATRRIAVALVWLVAFAFAYPYLPGASTEAFKGLSVLIGVMISLGSTGVVSQAMSGLVVIYSRSLSQGDYVRFGEIAGVVSEVGLLSTKVVTMRGEEVTIPNNVIVGGPVRNFSRLSRDKGPLVATEVSIGYDAPWRQVQALLIEAAGRTPGLRKDSEPFVLQSKLGDFYVSYDLIARLENPIDRPQVLSALHGNIQDAFNAAGVQIMSPHFMDQPPEPIVVPKQRWHDSSQVDNEPSGSARVGTGA
jgi:small-conductance mechanosensitive channel